MTNCSRAREQAQVAGPPRTIRSSREWQWDSSMVMVTEGETLAPSRGPGGAGFRPRPRPLAGWEQRRHNVQGLSDDGSAAAGGTGLSRPEQAISQIKTNSREFSQRQVHTHSTRVGREHRKKTGQFSAARRSRSLPAKRARPVVNPSRLGRPRRQGCGQTFCSLNTHSHTHREGGSMFSGRYLGTHP